MHQFIVSEQVTTLRKATNYYQEMKSDSNYFNSHPYSKVLDSPPAEYDAEQYADRARNPSGGGEKHKVKTFTDVALCKVATFN